MKELRIIGGTSELIIRDNPDAEISVNGKKMSVSQFLEIVEKGLKDKEDCLSAYWRGYWEGYWRGYNDNKPNYYWSEPNGTIIITNESENETT